MKFTNSKQKLTQKELEDFEKQYNLKLPKTYKEIILEYNGGYPEKRYFKDYRFYFFPIKYGDSPTVERMIEVTPEDVLPKGFFNFGDSCGLMLCISLNEKDYGTIYYVDETGEYDKVADSLEEVMEGLSEEDYY